MAQQTEFMPYEQALELKELGFDEPCLSYYEGESFSYHLATMTSGDNYITPAPLYQQAFRWFREKYGLHSEIRYIDDVLVYGYLITEIKTNMELEDKFRFTYEQAELACLKKLIEIVKNK